MKILLIGSGGREHALAWKISQSPLCTFLFIAPGNPGTAALGTNVNIDPTDFAGIADLCRKEDIGMVVVGPEAPLVLGITDTFRNSDLAHIKVIGPSASASRLEGSKAFAKRFMRKYQVPTAGYLEVTAASVEEGIAFLHQLDPPYVLKADGLAAGKGVLIIPDREEAVTQLRAMLDGMFGTASEKVVIEEFLDGTEFSVFALTDGHTWVLLPEAKDYKRIGEKDTGPNTGGMGAVSPVPFADSAMMAKVTKKIVEPTIRGIEDEGMDYTGFVFFGLISVKGEPYVIEYNCRLGDPETEAILPRLEDDLVSLLLAAADGKLSGLKTTFSPFASATVVMVSGGYPGDYRKGLHVSGIPADGDTLVFHAGTSLSNEQLVTNGGRVLAVTTTDMDFMKAVQRSLETADRITYEGKYYRRDIGNDL